MQRMIRNMVNRCKIRTAGDANRSTNDETKRWSLAGPARAVVGATVTLAASMLISTGQVNAQSRVALANYDTEASGFVTPAGMPPIGMMPPSAIMPVGYSEYGCDSGACDTGCDAMMMGGQSMRVCGTCGGNGGCGCNSFLGEGGLLGKMKSGGGSACLFCRGSGCTACKELPFGYAGAAFADMFAILKPYEGAQICQQRWYDVSVEALVLDRNIGGSVPDTVTTQGVAGTPVLTLGNVGSGDLEAGVRVSAAFLWGPGGNVEGTYMGGNEWGGNATVNGPADLFSFISDFGTNPAGIDPGFDDTDRSLSQSLAVRSLFHSAEINYRRRTMFPYCRFQSSWLIGIRYLRYDNDLTYTTRGLNNNTLANNGLRFFQSDSETDNNLFGPQAGFDFWWNAAPGISLGVGAKGAWMQNDIEQSFQIAGNSLGPGATPGTVTINDSFQDGTIMGDFEFKMVYRFTHSLSLRSSYYALVVEDAAFGGVDAATAQSLIRTGTGTPPAGLDDLVLQGFTAGVEYLW